MQFMAPPRWLYFWGTPCHQLHFGHHNWVKAIGHALIQLCTGIKLLSASSDGPSAAAVPSLIDSQTLYE